MWGEVTPAERLRAVTRRGVDDDRLASEAASALAGFADEPASLVVACRRVLAHHPSHAPLWWACSRILAAAEPGAEARSVERELDTDRTGERLGATLPLLDEGQVIAAIGWPAAVDEALIERFDIEAVAIRVEGADPTRALRRRRSDHAVRVVDMTASNSWAEFASLFCETRKAHADHERARSELKALIPEDAKEAVGHGIRAKRSKSGAISFDLVEKEAGHASLQ